jgi:hypothetical protein
MGTISKYIWADVAFLAALLGVMIAGVFGFRHFFAVFAGLGIAYLVFRVWRRVRHPRP